LTRHDPRLIKALLTTAPRAVDKDTRDTNQPTCPENGAQDSSSYIVAAQSDEDSRGDRGQADYQCGDDTCPGASTITYDGVPF